MTESPRAAGLYAKLRFYGTYTVRCTDLDSGFHSRWIPVFA